MNYVQSVRRLQLRRVGSDEKKTQKLVQSTTLRGESPGGGVPLQAAEDFLKLQTLKNAFKGIFLYIITAYLSKL